MSSTEEYELYADGRYVGDAFRREMSEVAKIVTANPEKTFLVIDQSGALIEMQKAERMDGLPLFLYDLSKENQLLHQKKERLEREIMELKSLLSSLRK